MTITELPELPTSANLPLWLALSIVCQVAATSCNARWRTACDQRLERFGRGAEWLEWPGMAGVLGGQWAGRPVPLSDVRSFGAETA